MNSAARFLSEYAALSRILEARDLAALVKATVTQAPAILRSKKLTELDAAMSRDMTVHVGETAIKLPLVAIDRILLPRNDNPTFGNVRELYARDVYFEKLKLRAPLRAVLDLGANRGMFTLLTLLALKAEIAVGVEPVEVYGSVYALLLAANGIAPQRAPRYSKFISSKTEEQQNTTRNLSIDTIFREQQIDRFDLVKIDIEGGELSLFSEPEWLDKVDNITMELHPKFVGDLSLIPAALERYGFQYAMVDQAGKPDRIESAMFLYASRTGALSA